MFACVYICIYIYYPPPSARPIPTPSLSVGHLDHVAHSGAVKEDGMCSQTHSPAQNDACGESLKSLVMMFPTVLRKESPWPMTS